MNFLTRTQSVLLVGAAVAATALVYFLLQENVSTPSELKGHRGSSALENSESGSVELPRQANVRVHRSPKSLESDVSGAPQDIVDISHSIYDSSREFREAAIQVVEREMESRRQLYPDGWVRWRPVVIDQTDITNGNYLDADTVASEFLISPFPDVTYRATRTEYRPRESTASASWFGELDAGASGTIKITIITTEMGADLKIRLRTPEGSFNIFPTELYGAYVAAEPNATFWATQLAN